MNPGSYASAGLTIACIILLVVASVSLGSAVATEPGEAVTLDYQSLPIEGEDVAELSRQLDNPSSGAETAPSQNADQGPDGERASRSSASSSLTEQAKPTKQAESEGSNPTSEEGSLLDRLLDLLRTLIALVLDGAPMIAVAVVIGVLVRYRRRFYDRFRSSIGRGPDSTSATRGPPSPENDVEAAWYEMIDAVGIADRDELTPREIQNRIRAVVDSQDVVTLTRLFEEVTYGGAPVTDERRRRARNCVRSIRDAADGGFS